MPLHKQYFQIKKKFSKKGVRDIHGVIFPSVGTSLMALIKFAPQIWAKISYRMFQWYDLKGYDLNVLKEQEHFFNPHLKYAY